MHIDTAVAQGPTKIIQVIANYETFYNWRSEDESGLSQYGKVEIVQKAFKNAIKIGCTVYPTSKL